MTRFFIKAKKWKAKGWVDTELVIDVDESGKVTAV